MDDSSKPVFWQFITTIPRKLYAKIEKRLLNSFLINCKNMSKCVKNIKIWPFRPGKKTTFRVIQANLSFDNSLVLGHLYDKLENSLLNRFGANGLQVQKGQNLTLTTLKRVTFRAIKPNLSFDMWFMSSQRRSMPKTTKSYWSVSEIDPYPLNLDAQTNEHTDRRTTNNSPLEKLRCLSAGGAIKFTHIPYESVPTLIWHFYKVTLIIHFQQTTVNCVSWMFYSNSLLCMLQKPHFWQSESM